MNRLISFINTKKIRLVLFFLFILASLYDGIYLRKIGYNVIPEPGVILDEYTNVWHGLSIRENGLPVAWSSLPAYKDNAYKTGSGGDLKGFGIRIGDSKINFRNFKGFPNPILIVQEIDLTKNYSFGKGAKHVWFVEPYLDHPPIGTLMLSLGVPSTTKNFLDLDSIDMRRVSLYLAVIVQILIAIVAYQLSGSLLVSLFSSFIYATAPSYLLLSRYALLENVLTPLLLVSLSTLLFIHSNNKINGTLVNKILLVLAGVISGMCALTKLSGWTSIFLGLVLLIKWKALKREIFLFCIPGVVIGSLYFLWGLYLSPRLFLDLTIFQGIARGFIGPINLLVTAWKVSILNFPVDGWWTGGFIAFLLVKNKKEYFPIYASTILILLSALVLVGANYPWYFIPLIPFMCIVTAIFIHQLITKPNFIDILILFFVFVSTSFYWGYGVFYAAKVENNYSQPFMYYRLLAVVFLGLAFVSEFLNKNKRYKRLWSYFFVALFFALVLLNHHGIIYMLANWGKLPLIYTPGTF